MPDRKKQAIYLIMKQRMLQKKRDRRLPKGMFLSLL